MFTREHRADTMHGLLFIILFSLAAFYIASLPAVMKLSISPLIVGIVLGMIYANTLYKKLPSSWQPGVKFCTKQILRTGIVLYGFRLTLTDVYAVGMPAVIVDAIIVSGTLLLGVLLGRILRMDRQTALMTATGSSICGAAAVLGAEGVVKCDSYKTAIAVSTVVIFGTIAMFLYPLLYRSGVLSSMSDTAVAIYTGATLHEVAHVAGAGNALDPNDLTGMAATATITKMIRVMMLAPVLVIMAFILSVKKSANAHNSEKTKTRITIPYFAFGFVLIIILNTILSSLYGAESVKELPLNSQIEYIDNFLLTMAMTALGVESSFDKFKKAGSKPFILALLLFIWLSVGGYFITDYVVTICGN